jgi:hypothetical protein
MRSGENANAAPLIAWYRPPPLDARRGGFNLE